LSSRERRFKLKVCLVGEEAVGKTSLIRRFVTQQFDAAYLQTIGTLVTKRDVVLPDPDGGRARVTLLLWDIMGRRDFMQLFREAYFAGARAVIAVFDVARPETGDALDPWIRGVCDVVGAVPVVVLANKVDLLGEARRAADPWEDVGARYEAEVLPTSAKTGDNVERAFLAAAQAAQKRLLRRTSG
jgi:small GTP-binding protein